MDLKLGTFCQMLKLFILYIKYKLNKRNNLMKYEQHFRLNADVPPVTLLTSDLNNNSQQ